MNFKRQIYGLFHVVLFSVSTSSWIRCVKTMIENSGYGPQFKNTMWILCVSEYSIEFLSPASGIFNSTAVEGDSWALGLRRAIDDWMWGWLFAVQVILFFANFFIYDGLKVRVPFLGSAQILSGLLPGTCAEASQLGGKWVWPCQRDRLLSWLGRLMAGGDGWKHLADYGELKDAVILIIACLYWAWAGSLCVESWRCPKKESGKDDDGMEVNEKLEAQDAFHSDGVSKTDTVFLNGN